MFGCLENLRKSLKESNGCKLEETDSNFLGSLVTSSGVDFIAEVSVFSFSY